MKDDVYQHFKREEVPVIDAFFDRINQVQNEYRPILTEFLDPRMQYIAQSLVGQRDDVRVSFFGGYANAERKRALFYPEYFTPTEADFKVVPLEIGYPQKFSQLAHGQILGTFANAGLDRNVLGDIITDGQRWQILINQDLATYLVGQIDRVGKIKVRLQQLSLADLLTPQADDAELMVLNLSSSRLDSVIAGAYNISRKSAKDLIKEKRVHLNWMMVEKPDLEIGEHDILSVRRYGRIKVGPVLGITRKDKIRLEVSVVRKKKR